MSTPQSASNPTGDLQGSPGNGGKILHSPAGKRLAQVFPLDRVEIARDQVYPLADRERLVEQLTIALSDFYVHLYRKREIYGFDPVRALQLLRLSMNELSDGQFHEDIAEIVARVRDRHLMFFGRAPYGTFAILPFTIETCWQEGERQYVVTKIDKDYNTRFLHIGAVVSHWNGIPIDRVVRLNANLFDGGNEAAALARSLAFLTSRPLREFGAPFEDWVDLTFQLGDVRHEERFAWSGFTASAISRGPAIGRNSTGFGGDLHLFELQQSRRIRFAPATFDGQSSARPGAVYVPVIDGSGAGGVFDYGTVPAVDRAFGYLRFRSFRADNVDDLVDALSPILPNLPQNGLIMDIRGNTGGYIAAGERLLQLLSNNPITPARFQFRVTELTSAMVQKTDDFAAWRSSFLEAIQTGELYTRGFPIEGADEDFNHVGRKYSGPTVLISDALAFSTADIFAAGFTDNNVGKIICTDDNMAAAGGNNWVPWDIIRLYNSDFRLDPRFKADFTGGRLTGELCETFNNAGVSISNDAVVEPGYPEYEGTTWVVRDGVLEHRVRDLPWMGFPLAVYLDRSPSGIADMPSGITFSVTLRRSIRVNRNEGRVLEDVGIVPDVRYQMTRRDILENNQDLFARACHELENMNVSD